MWKHTLQMASSESAVWSTWFSLAEAMSTAGGKPGCQALPVPLHCPVRSSLHLWGQTTAFVTALGFLSLWQVWRRKKKIKKETLLVCAYTLPAGIGFLATLCPLRMKL